MLNQIYVVIWRHYRPQGFRPRFTELRFLCEKLETQTSGYSDHDPDGIKS